jgi:hypothetical protein
MWPGPVFNAYNEMTAPSPPDWAEEHIRRLTAAGFQSSSQFYNINSFESVERLWRRNRRWLVRQAHQQDRHVLCEHGRVITGQWICLEPARRSPELPAQGLLSVVYPLTIPLLNH